MGASCESKVREKLAKLQTRVKVPKTQYNDFGKYKYRSCEDICEAIKPHLGDATLTLGDEIVMVGDRYYVKATAILTEGGESISNAASAREEDTKKGMDASQITGAASSYSRKYALAGLLLLDDNRDADAHTAGNTPQESLKEKMEKNKESSKPIPPKIFDKKDEEEIVSGRIVIPVSITQRKTKAQGKSEAGTTYTITDTTGEKHTTSTRRFAEIAKQAITAKGSSLDIRKNPAGDIVGCIALPAHEDTAPDPKKMIPCPDIDGQMVMRIVCGNCPQREECPAWHQDNQGEEKV